MITGSLTSRIIWTWAFPLGAKKTAVNLKTGLLKQLGEFGLTPDEVNRLVFVSYQAANMQAALFRWVQKIQNTMLKHTFKKSNEGDKEHDETRKYWNKSLNWAIQVP